MVQVEIVGSGDGEDVIFRMPGGMQNFFVEVETVDGNLILFAFIRDADFARFQQLAGTNVFARRLESRLPFGRAAIEHPEEIVVTPRHDLSIVALPRTLELVENTEME